MKTIYSVSLGSISAVFGAVLKDAGYTLVNDIVSAVLGVGIALASVYFDKNIITDIGLGFGIGYGGVSLFNVAGFK